MDYMDVEKQTLRLKRGRDNLLAVAAFSGVNLVLTVVNASFYFLFSATAPQFIYAIGQELAGPGNSYHLIGLLGAVFVVALYFFCWLMMKRTPGFIAVALAFFTIDCLLFVFLLLVAGFDFSYLVDIIFHGWVMIYLVGGTLAWLKLRKVSPADMNEAVQ